jgi:GT2 family glycosyltransferase
MPDPVHEDMQAHSARLRACERELAALRAAVQQLSVPPAPPVAPLWRRVGRRAVRALRRQRFAFVIEPAIDVRRVGTQRLQYACTGPQPQLGLICQQSRLPYGWVRISLQLRHESAHPISLRLFQDAGDGFSLTDAQALPMPNAQGRIEQVRYLPPGLQRLRLSPCVQDSATFSVADFCIQEITKQQALAQMLVQATIERRISPRRIPKLAGKLVRHLHRGGIAGTLATLQRRGSQSNFLYANWVRQFDTLTPQDLSAMAAHIERFDYRPRISVIMPVFNPPEDFLRRAIASVRAQVYPDWQLCIADDASTEPYVAEILRAAAAEDTRIDVVFRPKQGHICEATNSALARATGTFVAFLDHDDALREHALYMVAHTLQTHDDAGLIYSDEDKINANDQRYDPYFKSGYNPELLRSQNYINHLACYRRSLVSQVGNLRPGFEGSQDYDLALRVTGLLRPEQVHRIAHVLYLWRAIEGSTAHTPQAKPYTFDAARRALEEDLKRRGVDARIELRADGFFRTRYTVPTPNPCVSIIIPTRDRVELLRQCIDSIMQRSSYRNYEILVVDNDSAQKATLDYFAQLQNVSQVRVIPFHQAFNYASINNAAAAVAKGDVLCLMNNDIEVVSPDWLEEMVGLAMRPDVGAVGAKLYYPNRTLQHAGVVLGVGGIAGHAHKHLPGDDPGSFSRASLTQQFSAVTGACLMVRRDLYQSIGGLDPKLRVAYNDVDFCLRLGQAGHKIIWTPYAEFIHHESATRGADTTGEQLARVERESALMRERWNALLTDDPYYSPNLTLSVEDFSLALPPRAPRPWLAPQ